MFGSKMANVGDPVNRKSSQLNRLRQQLRKKREALADQFEYKMYMIFHFREKVKPCAVFEIAEVVPVMTNNYEDSILKGAKDEAYSYESSLELLEKDVVQLHAPRWQSMRKDVIGCTTEMDFFLWPRSDILRIECRLFSRWKGEEMPFKPLQADFEFLCDDYERQLMRLLTRKEKNGLIINNPAQSMFLFVDRQHLETAKRKAIVFKLSSVCLYLPQDQLTMWGPGNCDQIMEEFLTSAPSSPTSALPASLSSNHTSDHTSSDSISPSHSPPIHTSSSQNNNNSSGLQCSITPSDCS